jgi:hypothetical protein
MRVVVTDGWIEIEDGPEMPQNDPEWSCRKAAITASLWAIQRLSDEVAKTIAVPGGGKIALP